MHPRRQGDDFRAQRGVRRNPRYESSTHSPSKVGIQERRGGIANQGRVFRFCKKGRSNAKGPRASRPSLTWGHHPDGTASLRNIPMPKIEAELVIRRERQGPLSSATPHPLDTGLAAGASLDGPCCARAWISSSERPLGSFSDRQSSSIPSPRRPSRPRHWPGS
jgi:hypothetical protein